MGSWKCKKCGRIVPDLSTPHIPPMHAHEAMEPMPRKLHLLINAAKTALQDKTVAQYIWDHTRTEPSVDAAMLTIRNVANMKDNLLCDWAKKDDFVRWS